jgi:hypothetical protein
MVFAGSFAANKHPKNPFFLAMGRNATGLSYFMKICCIYY